MKYILLFSLLFLSFAEAKLPDHEMQRYCKERAVDKYNLQRNKIYTAVPRYLYGKYSVYAQSPKGKKNALFFVCHFSPSGRMTAIRTEKDLRKRRTSVVTQEAKRSCRREAASIWRLSRRDIDIVKSRVVRNSRYHLTVEAHNRRALCDVNAQGYIYDFKRENRSVRLPSSAKRACFSSAGRFWRVPVSRIGIDKVKRNKYGRYNVTLRYRDITGRCDVAANGYVHHFKTKHRR